MTENIKEKAAFWSIIASMTLTIGKLVAGLLSGSLALMSEAGHALLDTGATLITYFAIKAADKPADDDHHYGHGKIEALAALIETSLLMVLAGVVLYEAYHRLGLETATVDASPLAFGVLMVSVVIDLNRWRSLSRIAKETRSEALAADALHFASDMISSVLVLIGLAATAYGFKQADTLAALGVALFIAIAGFKLGRRTIDTLIDAAPDGASQHLREAIERIAGVVKIESLRIRAGGANLFAEATIGVARTASHDRVARIRNQVLDTACALYPEINLTLSTIPVALDEETVLERILLIAAHKRVPVHHVTVLNLGETLSISLDIEVDARMSLGTAHAIATRLEGAIKHEFGEKTEVETHIEPLTVALLEGVNAPKDMCETITTHLKEQACAKITDIHNVRVRENVQGLIVNYHCRVDPNISVAEIHGLVDRLEQETKVRFPQIARIVSHTEPLRSTPAAH